MNLKTLVRRKATAVWAFIFLATIRIMIAVLNYSIIWGVCILPPLAIASAVLQGFVLKQIEKKEGVYL